MELLKKIDETTDSFAFSSLEVLVPFLQVIHGEDVPASVTLASLQSIKFLLADCEFNKLTFDYDFFQHLLYFLTSCQFETTDQVSAELVILEILHIFKLILRDSVYCTFLTDSMVCGICQVMFSICVHPKIGDLLKRIAEREVIDILEIIFGKLSKLTNEDELIIVDESSLKISKKLSFDLEQPSASSNSSSTIELSSIDKRSFGFPCIKEILSYLGDCLEDAFMPPSLSKPISDKNKIFSTNLLRAIFTNSSSLFLKFRSCLVIVKNVILKRLIQIVVESENPILLQNSTTILTLSFISFSPQLMTSFEVYIKCLLNRLTSNIGKVRFAETNEILLWSLNSLMKEEKFPMFIFQFFDCTMKKSFLFAELIKFLTTKHTENNQIIYLNYLCLDIAMVILRNFWKFSYETNTDFTNNENFHITLGNEVQKNLSIKKQHVECARRFNENPSDGIAALKEHGIISVLSDHIGIAKFLFEEDSLDAVQLGLYLSKSKDFNKKILLEFMKLFNFNSFSIDQSLRIVLSHFRLPGEAQQIWNIMDAFSTVFFECGQVNTFKSKDSVFVLAYSIILLNTDLHNSRVKNKMKVEEFIRNNAAVNDGSNFEEPYLVSIYNNIRDNEIIFPEEQSPSEQFSYLWKSVVTDTVDEKGFILCLDPKLVHVILMLYLADFVNSSFVLLRDTKSNVIFNECREILFLLFSFCKQFQDYSSFESVLGRLIDHFNNTGFDIQDTKFVEILRFLIFIINQNITLLHIQGWIFLFDILEKLFINNLIPKNYLLSTDYKEGQKVLENISSSNLKKSPQSAMSNIRIISALTSILTGSNTSLNDSVNSSKANPDNWNDFMLLLEKDGMLFDFVKKSKEISMERLSQILDYLSNEKFVEPGCILFVEIFINICISNWSRIDSVFNIFFDNLKNLFRNESVSVDVKERIVVGIIRLSETLLKHEYSQHENLLLECLSLVKIILSTPKEFELFGSQVSHGTLALTKCFIHLKITSSSLWGALYELCYLLAQHPQHELVMADCFSSFVENPECFHFQQDLNLLRQFRNSMNEQVLTSVYQSVFTIFNRILSQETSLDDRFQNIFSLISFYSQSLQNPISGQMAMTNLQRIFLHSDLIDQIKSLNDPSFVSRIFTDIIFPSMLENSDSEIRQRLVGLSSKIFLQCLNGKLFEGSEEHSLQNDISPGSPFYLIWNKLLEMYQIYHNSENDLVRESVNESLKNLVLVLINMSILCSNNENMWKSSWDKLKLILPSLYFEYNQTEKDSSLTNDESSPISDKNNISLEINGLKNMKISNEEIYI